MIITVPYKIKRKITPLTNNHKTTKLPPFSQNYKLLTTINYYKPNSTYDSYKSDYKNTTIH